MTQLPFELELETPFLIARFKEPQKMLGWSIVAPGFSSRKDVVWLEVADDDLPVHVDPANFLRRKLSAQGLARAAAFMTSREIRRHHLAQSRVGAVVATCVTTVGLSNGEMVGARRKQQASHVGTINTLVCLSRALSSPAFIEAISIATQARTAAIMQTNGLRDGAPITGTGTDCMIIAAPDGEALEYCAGLHTESGEAIGTAVYQATHAGATGWYADLTPTKTMPLRQEALLKTKLYTKKGDRGATSLYSGRRAAKFDSRVAAIGDLDELSASIGMARIAYPPANELLRSAQHSLYLVSAIVSGEDRPIEMVFDEAEVGILESEIDRLTAELPELREFIIPGEAEPSCRLHVARAITRRAERGIAALTEPTPPDAILAYLNRLSDLLFALARQADQWQGQRETRLIPVLTDSDSCGDSRIV
jgi:cob(I)alamin adenosyltransferase